MNRLEARDQALEVLYEAEQREGTIHAAHLSAKAKRIVAGVLEHEEAIDEILTRLARKWSLDRMPVVDRVLLRLGIYELGHTETPTGVVISEVVRLAGEFSTERSGTFLNGVLAAYAKEARPGTED